MSTLSQFPFSYTGVPSLMFRQQVRVQELHLGSPRPNAPSMGQGPASGRRGIFGFRVLSSWTGVKTKLGPSKTGKGIHGVSKGSGRLLTM